MANTNEPQAQAPTKTLVWKQGDYHHARLLTPEHQGISREYLFDRDNKHTVEVDAADAAIIMEGPDKAEFRMKADKPE